MMGLFVPEPKNKYYILNLGEFTGEFHGLVIQAVNLMEPTNDRPFFNFF